MSSESSRLSDGDVERETIVVGPIGYRPTKPRPATNNGTGGPGTFDTMTFQMGARRLTSSAR